MPLAAVFTPMLLDAQGSMPAGLFSGYRWRMIGPFRGGRVNAVTGVPGQPNTFYFGSVGGGVWKTTNAGRTWAPVFDSQPIASIGAIARGSVEPGRRVRRHGRGGHAVADLLRQRHVQVDRRRQDVDAHRPRQHAADRPGASWTRAIPNVVFVAALGHVYGPNPDRGVFRSRDGGATWQKVLFKNENVGAIDLAIDPRNSQVIYASLWNTRRPPWSIYPPSYGPGSGLYKSTDGGTTWNQLTAGLPTEGVGRIGIADCAEQSEPRLRDRRREGGRPLPLRRRGRHVDEDLGRPAHLGARLVFLQDRRRPEERRDRLRVEHLAVPVDGRRARRGARRSRARRAATTTTGCGSTRTIRSG